jgi:hypothetical protein
MSDIDDELFALAGGDEDADVEEGEASSPAASSPNSLGSDATLERGEAFHRCRWSFELTPTGGQPELNLFLSR